MDGHVVLIHFRIETVRVLLFDQLVKRAAVLLQKFHTFLNGLKQRGKPLVRFLKNHADNIKTRKLHTQSLTFLVMP